MRNHYGNTLTGDRLRRARVAKGFSTAQKATAAFGWSPATYAAHESGARRCPLTQLQVYAAAFDVPEEWLATGAYPTDELGLDRLSVISEAPIAEIPDRLAHLERGHPYRPQWQRLRLARAARGISSASQAATSFGWKHSTYTAHENGQNRLTEATAEIYGRAFDVSPRWLLDGTEPSGLRHDLGVVRGPLLDEARLNGAANVHGPAGEKRRPLTAVTVPQLSSISETESHIVGSWRIPSAHIPDSAASSDLYALAVTEEFELAADVRVHDVLLVLPSRLLKQAIAVITQDQGVLRIHVTLPEKGESEFVGSVIAILWRSAADLSDDHASNSRS